SGRWSIVEHVPLVLEFIDQAQAIGAFLSDVAEIVSDGMATLERAHVLVYRADRRTKAVLPLQTPEPVAPLSTLPTAEEFPIMKLSEEGVLLRVFIGDSDTWEEQPLYRAIVLKARKLGLAGATVLRGPMGFGASSRVHTAKLVDVSSDLPVVIE